MKKIIIAIVALLSLYNCEKENISTDTNSKDENISIDTHSENSPLPIKELTISKKTTKVKGRYLWRLEFDYDNSTSVVPFTRKIELWEHKKFYTEFLLEQFNIESVFKLNGELSFHLNFNAAINETEINHHEHIELAIEAENKCNELAHLDKKDLTTELDLAVGSGKSLKLYRLIYISDVGFYETSIISTTPKEETIAELEFSLTEQILGVDEMLDVLRSTTPMRDNKAEWKLIQDEIARVRLKNIDTKLYHLLTVLSKISPKQNNSNEWKEIRTTCSEILNDWNTSDKNRLFRKFLFRLKSIEPKSSNKKEWKTIREKAEHIYNGTIEIF